MTAEALAPPPHWAAHVADLVVSSLRSERAGISHTSPADHAYETLRNIDELRAREAAIAVPGADAVLTVPQQEAVAAAGVLHKEKGVVRALTPHLLALRFEAGPRSTQRLWVNSEEIQWLEKADSPFILRQLQLKPDGFVAHFPFVSFRDAVGVQGRNAQGAVGPYFFGKLAHMSLQLQGCCRELYEGKLSVPSSTDFGQFFMRHHVIPGPCCGLLFDSESFWLYKSNSGTPVRFVEGWQWTMPGSRAALLSFFADIPEPPLLVALRELLETWGLHIATRTADGGYRQSFLGAGAWGHVFLVERQPEAAAGADAAGLGAAAAAVVAEPAEAAAAEAGGAAAAAAPIRHFRREQFALKIVMLPDVRPGRDDEVRGAKLAVEDEHMHLVSAYQAGAPVVQCMEDHFHCCRTVRACGYLMQAADGCAEINSRADCEAAFVALQGLHEAGFIHGDARLPNLVRVGARLLWVDMLGGSPVQVPQRLHERAARDASLLASSILRLQSGPMPADISAAISLYRAAMTSDNARAVGAAVWAAKRR